MHINRNNYEEYFLLYTDNELSAADRQAVEAFVQQNPDLQKELAMLQDTTLTPDNSVVFKNKEILMQAPVAAAFIHHENYQEVFVLYSDDELGKDEKTAVEKFVYDHPHYQEEFELIQSLKFYPDLSITFPGKNSLYHHPEAGTKPVIFTWGRIAAAASVLIFAGLVWLVQPRKNSSQQLAKTEIKPLSNPRALVSTKVSPEKPAIVSEKIEVTPPPSLFKRNDVAPGKNREVQTKSLLSANLPRTRPERKIHEDRPGTAKSESRLAKTTADVKPPRPETGKAVQQDPPNNDVAAHVTRPTEQTHESGNTPPMIHTLVNDQQSTHTSDLVMAADDHTDNISVAGFTIDKKSSLRGILRKASRFIDKTTSIRPVKKQGLVVGNIEIGFQ